MVVQTWAWVNMINDRVPQQGVSAALDSTFSGDLPCAMCCAIAQERQENQERAPIPESEPTAKFPPASWSTMDMVFPPALTYLTRLRDMEIEELARQDEPSLPPPQVG